MFAMTARASAEALMRKNDLAIKYTPAATMVAA
jgi:hypothetical protein